MQGGGSDAESSGDGRPLFRPMLAKPRSQTSGMQRRRKSSVQDVVEAALLNGLSSDEDMPRARHIAALKNLRRTSENQGKKRGGGTDGANDEGDGKSAAPRKRAKGRLLTPVKPPSEDEEDITADPSRMMEETMRYLRTQENDPNQENAPSRRKMAKPKAEVKRKDIKKGGTTKVLLENGNKSSPDKPDDEKTPEKEARMRLKSAGKGGGKGKSKKGGSDSLGLESEEEEEGGIAKEQLQAWEEDFNARVDKKFPNAPATAFSIKPCDPSSIRQLTAECFLGKKRPEEGGFYLIDADGLINIHFLLGTQKQLQKLRERRQKGDKTGDDVNKADIKYLKWLIIKALQLRVINKREMRSGRVKQERIKNAEKSLRWSLSRSANLAEYSDNEGEADDEISPELKFKQKEKAEDFKEIVEKNRSQLRTNVATRQRLISASSSHDINLDEVQDRLLAPSMSFDWEEKGSDDDDNLLEVDMPEQEGKNSKREIFLEQMHRSRSFHQAKGLSHRDRAKSNLSRSFSNINGMLPSAGASASQESLSHRQRTQSSSSLSGTGSDLANGNTESRSADKGKPLSDAPKSAEKAAAASLWEVLESQPSCRVEETGPAQQAEVSTSDVFSVPEDSARTKQQEVQEKTQPLDATTLEPEQPATTSVADTSMASTTVVSTTVECKDSKDTTTETMLEQAPDASDNLDKFLLRCEDASAAVADQAEPCGENVDLSRTGDLADASAPPESLSQDWSGITPTAMWAARIDSVDSTTSATDMEKSTRATNAEKDIEISPTAPIVLKQHAAPSQEMEISPTMPCIPMERPGEHVDISPTMPCIAVEKAGEHPDISSTFPCVAGGVGRSTGDTQNTADMECINPTLTAKPAADNKSDNSTVTTELEKPSLGKELEDSVSEGDSDVGGMEEEQGFEQDIKQKQREREWLRHKRRAARQEKKEAMQTVKRRKGQAYSDLGESLLSSQERTRFRNDFDNDVFATASPFGKSSVRPGIRSGDALEDADAFGVFGVPGGGIQKKKSFLMGTRT